MKRPVSANAIDYSGFAFPKGTVRLAGKELEALRRDCLKRDKSQCKKCGRTVSDKFPAWHPLKYDMAHKQSRGAGGSDTLDNVETNCHECHMQTHAGK